MNVVELLPTAPAGEPLQVQAHTIAPKADAVYGHTFKMPASIAGQ